MATKRHRTLVKFTVLAAFEGNELHNPSAHLEHLGDRLAELLRDEPKTITVASEYESVVQPHDPKDEDDDGLVVALAAQFPDDTLPVGPVPGVTVLGRAGKFPNARLVRKERHIELWLGIEREKFPLLSFPAEGGA